MEIDRLILLIKENPNTDFLIIRIPEHNKNELIYNNEIRYTNVKNLLSKYNNVTIKDYDDLILDDSDFRDFNHLSGKVEINSAKFFLDDNFK